MLPVEETVMLVTPGNECMMTKLSVLVGEMTKFSMEVEIL
jgi:hypothetical protein